MINFYLVTWSDGDNEPRLQAFHIKKDAENFQDSLSWASEIEHKIFHENPKTFRHEELINFITNLDLYFYG